MRDWVGHVLVAGFDVAGLAGSELLDVLVVVLAACVSMAPSRTTNTSGTSLTCETYGLSVQCGRTVA